jgi:CDP-glucose 4,6-dehydratase
MLAERLSGSPSRFAAGWNFGPAEADAQPVSSIADELARLWGAGASWVQDSAVRPHEAHLLKLDTSKAKACLNWRPVLPLRQALSWIVEWYRAFDAGENLAALTREQIERYEALAQEDYDATHPHSRSEHPALTGSLI